MARINSRAHAGGLQLQRTTDARKELRQAAQLKLSGATYEPACNPVDLTVPSSRRVIDVDFTDVRPIRQVRGTRVEITDADLDW